jgi:hypothetical protein
MAPATHLVDAAYISAAHLLAARETLDIDLVGPPRADLSWQHRQVLRDNQNRSPSDNLPYIRWWSSVWRAS